MSDCPTPKNGEWKSNLAGIVLGGASFYLLKAGLVPWEASAVGMGFALYLFLPKRYRAFGDLMLSWGQQAMTIWRAKKE